MVFIKKNAVELQTQEIEIHKALKSWLPERPAASDSGAGVEREWAQWLGGRWLELRIHDRSLTATDH
jgi:hypothetical protein